MKELLPWASFTFNPSLGTIAIEAAPIKIEELPIQGRHTGYGIVDEPVCD
jgi:hypothetical protein